MATHQSNNKSEEISCKRPRLENEEFQISVLRGDDALTSASIEEAYLKCQAVYIPNISTTNNKNPLTWKDFGNLFESLNEKDQESWCIENGQVEVSPSDFLKAHSTGYSSFLIQHSSQVLQDTLENKLPIKTLVEKWNYGPCLWCFFGVNSSSSETDLQGRPEHTDSVSHDGTWHYQLSGSKQWYLRPTEELLKICPQATSTMIHVQEGDVLVVNTRLWWHRTVIPPQPTPSISYARDFYMKSNTASTITNTKEEPMKNVDGLYAANNVEENTILFTEDDLPDCQLPHAASAESANCKVVQLEDGSSALVSTRYIHAGDFFCVLAESESSDDDDDEEAECSGEEVEEFESQDDDDDDSDEASC